MIFCDMSIKDPFKNNPTFRGIHQKGLGDLSVQLFVTLYTISICPSAHKQLRRYLLNPFREFPCICCLLQFFFK